MQLNTVSLSQFTDLVDRDWSINNVDFVDTGKAVKLFIHQDLAYHTGNSRRYTEIDSETFATVKDEGDDAAKAQVQQGYTKDLIARRFAKEIDITWEMRKFNKHPEVIAQLTSLSHFCPQRMELDLTHRLTFSLATSYTDIDGRTIATTVGDGKALVSATHTLRASSETFSNVITGNPAFSKGGLEVAELQANTQIRTQYNEKRIMMFNTIVTSDDPTTNNDVKQFLMSTTDVDQDNPGVVNVYKGKYQHLELPWLATTAVGAPNSAKAKYWGLVCSGQGQRGWQSYLGVWEAPNLKTPATGNNGEDFNNDNWTYGTRCTYGIATVSPRGFLWSTGVGA